MWTIKHWPFNDLEKTCKLILLKCEWCKFLNRRIFVVIIGKKKMQVVHVWHWSDTAAYILNRRRSFLTITSLPLIFQFSYSERCGNPINSSALFSSSCFSKLIFHYPLLQQLSFALTMKLLHWSNSTTLFPSLSLMIILIGIAILQFLRQIPGRKVLIAAHGMGSLVIMKKVKWLGLTWVAVGYMATSLPTVVSSVFHTCRNSTSPSTILTIPRCHLSLVGLQV